MSMGSQREGFKECLVGLAAVEDRSVIVGFGYKEGLWAVAFMLQVPKNPKSIGLKNK